MFRRNPSEIRAYATLRNLRNLRNLAEPYFILLFHQHQ